ncbi:MAG: DNA-formamidopyrimidine glycosylase [Halanaerobium sp.]|nr:DNA-formamidopyrimidine glycosylase [Halanaerobium sp.]
MPELPEVETVVRSLAKYLVDRVITGGTVLDGRIVAYPDDTGGFIDKVTRKRIDSIQRRGKYIILELSDPESKQGEEEYELVIHLRMSGKLLYQDKNVPIPAHTCVVFDLDDGCQLRFINIRKFGRMHLVKAGQRELAGGLANLGVEPLSPDFQLQDFIRRLKERSARIKGLLLNQSFLAGMGNIYVDEALFRAGIHPMRKASGLSEAEIARLFKAIRGVLQDGIEHRGTTRKDYVDADGQAGDFQNYLQVYGREGERCKLCSTPIERIKVAGRSSFVCPACQKFER